MTAETLTVQSMLHEGGWAVAVVVAAAFAGAFVKGVTTLGLALFAVPLISLFLDVQTAILSLFLSKCLSDVAMLADAKKTMPWAAARRVGPFTLVGFASIPAATWLLASAKGPWLYLFLAASILVFVAYQLAARRVVTAAAHKPRWTWALGVGAGVSQGLTGAAGPYAAMYLFGLRLKPGEFVFLSSVIYLVFDVSQLAAIVATGLYDRTRLLYALLTIVPVLAGTYLGIRVRGTMNERQFRNALLMILVVSALALVARAGRA